MNKISSLTRRDFLKYSNASFISFALSNYLLGCGQSNNGDSGDIDLSNITKINAKSLFKAPKDMDFTIDVSGSIPSDLEGSLYRNGPSLFERNGFKKNHLLDGEGYITKLSIENSTATLKGSYVQTDKFIKESKAQKFTEDTFTTIVSDKDEQSILSNNDANKSSVSIKEIDGKMYSFEESLPPYIINKETLSTSKSKDFFQTMPFHSAHAKKDVQNGDFVNFGIQMGDPQKGNSLEALYIYLHVYVLNKGKTKMYRKIKLTGILDEVSGPYMHDFFLTENYIIFNLQPFLIELKHLYPANKAFEIKEKSLAHSFVEKSNIKNKLLIISRVNPNSKPLIIEAPSTKYFWHTINAYENNKSQINLEFIAYNKFNFFSKNHPLSTIIQDGVLNIGDTKNGNIDGFAMRYEVSMESFSDKEQFFTKGSIKEVVLSKSYKGDFPMINPNFISKPQEFFYQGLSEKEGYFINGLGKFNIKNSDFEQTFFFSKEHVCGEAVFCLKSHGVDEDDGYLISTCHNLKKQKTFVAIFDAKNIKKGPISKLFLEDTLPYRLHGEWVGN